MEYFWLAIAIASAIYAAYVLGKFGSEQNAVILALPLVAFVLFLLRRFSRKRMEKESQKHQE